MSAGWDSEEAATYPRWRRLAVASVGPFHFDHDTDRDVIADFLRSTGHAP